MFTINTFSFVGPHRSVWISSNGFVVECSFVLKLNLVCFPIWQCLQIEYEGLITFGRSLIASFSLDLIKLSKLKFPNLLFHSQVSSYWLKQHFSPSSTSRIYTLLDVLGTTVTSFTISFFWSHISEIKGKYVTLITCMTHT